MPTATTRATAETAKAVPPPWTTDPASGHEMVLGSDGVLLADCCLLGNGRYPEVNRAHAALIVRAVNAHDALVAALERTLQTINRLAKAGNATIGDLRRRDEALDALRLARGER